MLELINRYCHGFVVFPVIHSLRKKQFFKNFEQSQAIEFEQICSSFQANPGHLKVALRLLESLDILKFDQGYQKGKRFNWIQQIPDDLDNFLQLDFSGEVISSATQSLFDDFLTRSLNHWSSEDQMLADFLDGLWVLPLFLQLKKTDINHQSFTELSGFFINQEKLEQCFLNKGWLEFQAGRIVFSPIGEHLRDRIFISATVYSYKPMLKGMTELIFGDTKKIFYSNDDGHENHLDRLLNVQGSGFQHERFFKDCHVIIVEIFNQLPLENQPDYIADMGCGDGSLLKKVYQLIKTQTRRGEQLKEYPLVLIGADYNKKALQATAITLANIPHQTIQADIGDPAQFLLDLRSVGVDDIDKVLHIRSFLDHDRPYIKPVNLSQLERRAEGRAHGVYVDSEGKLISGKEVFQSLVEHLSRWSTIIGNSGAMFLEVHSMAPKVISRYIDQCENLHFDAYHAFSGQLLVDADEFLLAAAESGLFPRLDFAKHYPKSFPFARITLNWFEKRDYCLRPALLHDLAQLVILDKACWAKNLTAGIDILRARLKYYPQGQFVIEQQGEVIGAVYTQRIQNENDLDKVDFNHLAEIHDPHGSIVQILGMNIDPNHQHLGLGDQVLSFLLNICTLNGNCTQVVGVSRCKQFVNQAELNMDQYLQKCRNSGQWDTVLNFHIQHGASVVKPIKDFWPNDVDNQGFGVLVSYTITEADNTKYEAIESGLLTDTSRRNQLIDQSILKILGDNRKHLFSDEKALMEMGLDSLDLLELRALLSSRLAVRIEPMFFFSYGTANAIKAYFNQDTQQIRADLEQSILANANVVHQSHKQQQDQQFEVAIVGMSCRFPDGIDSAESFWQYLKSGQDAIEKIPDERWDYKHYEPQGVNTFGGFIKNVDQFDAEFFNLTPREARLIDPQHRLLLETAWEAFEQAGINPQQARQTGVFVGLYAHDYELLAAEYNKDKCFDVYHAIGNSASMAAGRIAYFFGFNGPAICVDTACSSSLLAIQQACDSLRNTDCRLALAGGVNLMLTPDLSIAFSKSGMLAGDGKCKAFDINADGYVRSEGCGLILLKPLNDALRDNDSVLAVIKGIAVNQDGASNGITAPNGLAQQDLMQQALAKAKVKASDVSLLEAHGTGTPLGDPVEIEAVAKVYSHERTASNPLAISSVKTNIGHTESAAGVAGLIKLILAFKHQFIPPHLHLKNLNPRIPLTNIPACIPIEGMAWPSRKDKPRIAAISSFGFSGTNAHMIVSEAMVQSQNSPELPCVLPLSAKTAKALVQLIECYQQQVQDKDQNLLDIAATAATGRLHFNHRLAISASNTGQLIEKLSDCLSTQAMVNSEKPEIVFLFTGQGAQYLNMARELYCSRSYFRQLFDQCSALFEPYLQRSLCDLIYADDSTEQELLQTTLTQPALFTLEYALAKQWQQWGIIADVLIGHSIGEYAAACLAGIFTLEQAVKLVSKRGQLMQAQPTTGKMAAVNCTKQQLNQVLEGQDDVVIACFNAPERLVISGLASAVDNRLKVLTEAGISFTELNVSHAFHSPLMTAVIAEFNQTLEQIQFGLPTIRIISTLTGKDISDHMRTVDYWTEQIVQPVNFTGAIQTLCQLKDSRQLLLEIGPGSVLTGLAKQIANHAENILFLPALEPGVDDNLRIAENIGHFFELGLDIDWQAFYSSLPFNKVSLPTYPFQRQRYWLDQVYLAEPDQHKSNTGHPLLGQLIQSPLAEQYQNRISLGQMDWLAGHVVKQQVVFPLSAYIEMALAVTGSGLALNDLVSSKACILTDQVLQLHTVLQQKQIKIYSKSSAGWEQHFSCESSLLQQIDSELDLTQLQQQLSPINVDQFYQQKAACGYQFSAEFCSLKQLYKNADQALAYAEYDDFSEEYHIHPVLLDAAFQCALAVLPSDNDQQSYLPFSIERFDLWGKVEKGLWSHVQLKKQYQDATRVDINIYSSNGHAIASVAGLMFKRLINQVSNSTSAIEGLLHQLNWQQKDLSPSGHAVLEKLEKNFDQALAFQSIKGSGGRLNQLAITYICQALQQLGIDYQKLYPNVKVLIQQLAVNPRFERLFLRILDVLKLHDLAEHTSEGWLIKNIGSEQTANQLFVKLTTDYPALALEASLVKCCGENLKAIWCDEINPLQLIFPADNPNATTDFYRHSQSFVALNKLLAEAVEELTHSRLSNTGHCRILEIGAGTGSATYHILPKLMGKSCRYTYTDISSYFTQQAKQEFSDYDFLEYRSLDIASDPQAQGYAQQSYDLIIASNVLHATNNLNQVLHYCRQLLADGGQLILLEGVQATPWIDSVFGLTNGWWSFNDSLRQNYPLLSQSQWQNALQQQGLNAQSLMLEDQDAPFKQAVIIASAPNKSADCWLVMDDQKSFADELIQILNLKALTCIRVITAEQFKQIDEFNYQINPDLAEDYKKLIKTIEQHTSIERVVNFWPLSFAEQFDLSAEQLMQRIRFISCTGLYLIQALVDFTVAKIKLCHVTKAAQSINQQDNILSPEASVLWGMNKVVALEHPELKVSIVDLDEDQDSVSLFIKSLLENDGESQQAYRKGQRYVPRLALLESPVITEKNRVWQIKQTELGSISALQLNSQAKATIKTGQVEIKVQQAGLNFIDLMEVLNLLPFKREGIGMECVGVISRCAQDVQTFKPGQRVLAIGEGAFADYLCLDALQVVALPKSIQANAAITLPVAFLTASYALNEIAQIKPGQRILIHAAAGGTGMAAVQIALAAGAEVYATASQAKWPQVLALGVKHVMSSRELRFVKQIKQLTDGRGVDIVFNSLTGDFIKAGLSLLTPGGYFLEIGKREVLTNTELTKIAPEINYCLVDIRELTQRQPEKIQRLLQAVISKVEQGNLHALPHCSFDWLEMPDAFRYMQQAKQIGKIILQNRANYTEFSCCESACYLITGGLKGVGLFSAEWLAEKGAKHLYLLGRSKPTKVNTIKIKQLQAQGVEVVTLIADVTNLSEMQTAFTQIKQSGIPLKGIIHSVGVLSDSALSQQNWSRYQAVLAPKIIGAWHLHQLSQHDPLDFFLLYSSVASLLGSAGQSNHAAANAFLDTFSCYRRAQELPAQSINWCGWSEIGSAAELQVSDKIRKGLSAISTQQGGQVLASALARNDRQLAVIPMDWPVFLSDAPMQEVFQAFKPAISMADASEKQKIQSLSKETLVHLSDSERSRKVKNILTTELATVLGMEREQLKMLSQRQSGFFELGLDSLTSVEFKNRINQSLTVNLSSTAIFDYPTIQALTKHLNSILLSSEPVKEEVNTEDDDNLDELSIEQAAALLAKELG